MHRYTDAAARVCNAMHRYTNAAYRYTNAMYRYTDTAACVCNAMYRGCDASTGRRRVRVCNAVYRGTAIGGGLHGVAGLERGVAGPEHGSRERQRGVAGPGHGSRERQRGAAVPERGAAASWLPGAVWLHHVSSRLRGVAVGSRGVSSQGLPLQALQHNACCHATGESRAGPRVVGCQPFREAARPGRSRELLPPPFSLPYRARGAACLFSQGVGLRPRPWAGLCRPFGPG